MAWRPQKTRFIHEVGIEFLHGLAQDVARRERVRPRGLAVRDEDGLVRPAHESLAKNRLRSGKPHRDDGHGTAVGFLDPERRFEGVPVLGVEDRGQRRAVDGAIGFHRLARHLRRIGDLLDADNAIVAARAAGSIGFHKSTYYSKTDVDNLLGNIMQCQEAIIYLLDKDSIINIPSDD